ncbi:hypothetical protein LPB140_05285 [Sphingorhabdus lutea]|uniref:Class I SAM-dependent methyltransferase n=1 Tax=Sphingorhabdus lutea TaxID=1913578 RepID=A0A1L3JAZ6_9SPHN|nr:SAM-dependent methyltransferase [Sphingorhabdus lutea]APG62315.1 hypothetical protein LPB140_05285 [Sphingorhabdus lutea]
MPEQNILALKLAKQIGGNGPISLAEYMRQSNEEYYNISDPLGKEGDFITAPEISQIFGELVGIWFADIWMRSGEKNNINYVELGPGRGTLAKDILSVIARYGCTPPVHFVETSDALRVKQTQNCPNAIFHDKIDDLPENGPLFIIANEFFDALPINQAVQTHSGWREFVVARDRGNQFLAMPGTKDAGSYIPEEFKNASPHSLYEYCPDAANIMYELTRRVKEQGGLILVIDYGYMKPQLGSTLQAVANHKSVSAFNEPGTMDITAHVNFLELGNIARIGNLQVQGPIEQGIWLKNLGADIRAETLSAANPDQRDVIMQAKERLVHPEQMGSLFKVMAVLHNDLPRAEGFG